MVGNPEQAAYILSSSAGAEFLRNLPEGGNSQGSIECGATLGHLNLDDSSSVSSPPAPSRFFIFESVTRAPIPEMEGRITFTTFLVPRKVDNVHKCGITLKAFYDLRPSRL
ncbi:hypothetical protein P885DRAFT_57050 [Corynascus similis CBS 632.67]